ncbi:NTP pyrophosphohydrolase MutT [Gordonia effusa NBRC 100432]|uniref:NTP pyrophosphohydrolase MutT n=1 Tax=Gordonia effusa NBRC 100432 TaxID=1077974 RepID=H0QZT0_9ACTN|nr:NUDIX hydrolase [Gordonia effusa]GAB18331.1 NTP pyrophosphohydrolase MutT [Gordonia effusa NBRC 100432]
MTTKTSPDGRRIVWAAGGVLWRITGSSLQIGLVHRPRYDDWTLPKGKAEPGESIFTTAVREIAEETGFSSVLGRHLSTASYALNDHTNKRVHYWSARATGGDFVPNHEVDEFDWFDVAKAQRRLTYRLDRKILAQFTSLPADLHTFLLIRHAKAGRRSQYRGDDRLRPLDKNGRAQALALVDVLEAFGAQRVHAADRVRCIQTVAPFAQRVGTEIAIEQLLTEEAYRSDPSATHDRFTELACDTSYVRAVCSQGKVIPPTMQWWAQRDGVRLAPNRNRKGSVWVVSMTDDAMVAADHIASPLPTVTD